MRKFVRFLGIALLALLVLAVAPAVAHADDGGKTGDCDWKFIEAEHKLIISGNGDMDNYVPFGSTYGTQAPWMQYCQMIQEIQIENGVTSIGKYAFSGCSSVTYGVEIPESVRAIQDYAFSYCSLSYLHLSRGMQVIGERAFFGCDNLMRVYFPVVGLLGIGKAAFANTQSLCDVQLPVGLQNIGEYAFGYVTTPNAASGFARNENFGLITGFAGVAKTYANGNNIPFEELYTSGTTGDCTWVFDHISKTLRISGNGAMADYERHPNSQYPATTAPWVIFSGYFDELRILEGVTGIGNYAFCGMSIPYIDTATTTKRIGEYAYYFCQDVCEINVQGDRCVIGESAFAAINASDWQPAQVLDRITLSNVRVIGKNAFSYTQSREVSFSEGLERIEEYAFQGNNAVKKLVFPGTTEYVGMCAFWECEALESVAFLSGTGRGCQIDANVFYNDKALGELILGEGVASVGSMAFCNTALPSVTIPNSVGVLSDHCFGFDCYASDTFHTYAKKDDFSVYASCMQQAAKDYASLFGLPFVAQHSVVAKVTKATPEKDGKRQLQCSKCGAKQARATVIPMVSNIALSKTAFVYNGKIQKPTVTVKDRTGKELSKSYYKLVWSNANSKNVGIYTVTVQLKGTYYTGSKELAYSIRPAKVTGLKAANVSTTAIKLGWNAAAGAKYYAVYGAREGESFSRIGTVSATGVTVKKINGKALSAGGSYRFKVRGLDGGKVLPGPYSAVLETGTKTAAPLITKVVSSKSKTVSVAYSKVKGAVKYAIYASADNKNFKKKATTTRTNYTLSRLPAGVTVYIKVTAFNKYGIESAFSKVVAVKVKR